MTKLLALALSLALPPPANATQISHVENVSVLILHGDRNLTCFSDDYDSEQGEINFSASAIQKPIVLNGHQFGYSLTQHAEALCNELHALLDDAQEGHPGTGKWLTGVVSSSLNLEGTQLSEHVTLKVYAPMHPEKPYLFESTVTQHLTPG